MSNRRQRRRHLKRIRYIDTETTGVTFNGGQRLLSEIAGRTLYVKNMEFMRAYSKAPHSEIFEMLRNLYDGPAKYIHSTKRPKWKQRKRYWRER